MPSWWLQKAGKTDDGVFGFIALTPEIQVVRDGKVASFIDGSERDEHVEFAPAFLANLEGWFLVRCHRPIR